MPDVEDEVDFLDEEDPLIEGPKDPLPEPEKPLYDRDHRLPHSDLRDGDEIM